MSALYTDGIHTVAYGPAEEVFYLAQWGCLDLIVRVRQSRVLKNTHQRGLLYQRSETVYYVGRLSMIGLAYGAGEPATCFLSRAPTHTDEVRHWSCQTIFRQPRKQGY